MDWHRDNVRVTVLDTLTGETATDDRFSGYWWAEGNGSCDCNRALLFGGDVEAGYCEGRRRYLIVAVEGADLADFNHGYPAMTDAQLYAAVFPRAGLTAAQAHEIARDRFKYLRNDPEALKVYRRMVLDDDGLNGTGTNGAAVQCPGSTA